MDIFKMFYLELGYKQPNRFFFIRYPKSLNLEIVKLPIFDR